MFHHNSLIPVRMNKKQIISAILLLTAMGANAQDIAIENKNIDCGQVVFKHPVTAEYVMKNNGASPLTISDVRTSCGCTTVSYPKEAIAPGQSFTVSAVYDAKTMGHFNKRIGIYSNASSGPLMLSIKGVVVEEKDQPDLNYPYLLGDLHVDRTDLEFDDVNRGDEPVQVINIKNTTDQVVEPVLMHLPNYLRAEVRPSKIAPGRTGKALVQLDSRVLRDLGLTQTSVYLGMFMGDKVAPDKGITVSAVLLPDFDNMTSLQKARAPKLRLSSGSVELGGFSGKKSKKGKVTLINEGKTPLEIRSLQMFTAGLQVSLGNKTIAPGQKVDLKVTAIASILDKVKGKPRVLLITNDPENTKVIINVNVTK